MSELSFMDKLLDGAKVELLNLSQVTKIKHGKDWKGLNAGDIPVYGSGGIMGYVDEYAYDKPTVLIPRKGSITNIFYVESPFWNVDTIYSVGVRDIDTLHPDFAYYLLKQSELKLTGIQQKGGIPAVSKKQMEELLLPIPSIYKQERIVAILDKFDTLTTSISEGLPREIELRQKQYEYYRDLLLSFPKPDASKSEAAA